MPEGESWLSLFLKKFFPGFYGLLEHWAHYLGWPFNDKGRTWIAHDHIDLLHVLGALLVLIVVTTLAVIFSRRYRDSSVNTLIPDDRLNASTFVELVGSSTYGIMKDMMGAKAAKFFLPLIGTCAFFILFSNAQGLIPGLVPPTDKLNTTLACALVIFFATHIFGVKEHGLGYFKHFFGPLRAWYAAPLMLLMFLIEMISHLARPMSLSIRLMANMAADHLVLTIFLSLFAFLAPVPMMVLGTVVVIVQTFVFCLLSTVYIAGAIAHEGH